jgi:hypothetical protein
MAIVFVTLSVFHTPTPVENALFQLLSLGAGLLGSYHSGKQSAQSSAWELLTPIARSAFRRVLQLYGSLARLQQTVDQQSGEETPAIRLSIAYAIVREQLATASGSLEDWRDLVPNEVADVEQKLKASQQESTSFG